MKAVLAERPPRGDDWFFEVKWDGVRAIAFIDDEEVHLQSRSGNRCERQYPELAVIHHNVAGRQAILDGEIAVLDDKGVSRFHLIQPRIANTDPNSIAHLVRSTPVVYFVFDLLYLDGYDLRRVDFSKRRDLLESVITPSPVIRISEAFPASAGEALLDAARETGLEGILAKRAGSCYESKRSSDWQKIKIVTRQEFVIGGFTQPQGDRNYFGALVLGVMKDNQLHWVGNVGTGFDAKSLAHLNSLLQPLITKTCPFAETPTPAKGMTWVEPKLIAEVKFANWTQDNHLRAPVFEGLRVDKRPAEVQRESALPGPRAPAPGPQQKFSNLSKLYYPEDGYTKGDVLAYYDTIADLILPHLKDRPLSLKRYPNGIHSDFFFQKNTPENYPSWLRTEVIDDINYVFAEDRASLLYLVNLGCIDHNPWMSRTPHLDNPDFVLIDLDPMECPFEMIVEAACMVRDVLKKIGLAGYPKTTGGDGLHVYIPVDPIYTYDETRTFAELIARVVQSQNRALFTTPRSVAKRQKNRVYFDYLQNAKSKTIAAPYVLRAYPHAPVATPLDWKEVVPALHPTQFTIKNAPTRFAKKGDLFKPVLTNHQHLDEALEKLAVLL